MATVGLRDVVKRYGKVVAVDRISLDIADGEFIALLGPSGCGKTSTMRMIAGLEEITEGSILIGDRRVNDMAPAERNVAMAFENYGLYPHLSLFDNIAYPLRIRALPQTKVEAEVVRVARLLHIEQLLDRKPQEVSGGVQQRVSLARALVRKPTVFLLDEPLSHLDADLRSEMRGELKRLHEIGGSTTIYVTHDQLEAMTMADRIAIMNLGKLQQVGTPAEVFYLPANRFVASFVGEPATNIMQGTITRSSTETVLSVGGYRFASLGGRLAEAAAKAAAACNGRVDVGVRPPDFELRSDASEGVPARVRVREFIGEIVLLTLDAESTRVRVAAPRDTPGQEGDQVSIRPRQDRIHLFDCSSGDAIGHTGGASEVRSTQIESGVTYENGQSLLR